MQIEVVNQRLAGGAELDGLVYDIKIDGELYRNVKGYHFEYGSNSIVVKQPVPPLVKRQVISFQGDRFITQSQLHKPVVADNPIVKDNRNNFYINLEAGELLHIL